MTSTAIGPAAAMTLTAIRPLAMPLLSDAGAALPGDPAALRQAAASLGRSADALTAHGQDVGARVVEVSSGWTGAAAMAFDGGAAAVRRAAEHAGGQLREVSTAVRRHAEQLEAAQARLRVAAAREEDSLADATRWAAARRDGVSDPVAALCLQAATDQARAARVVADQARAECAASARDLARVLRETDPDSAVLAGLGDLGGVWPLRGILVDAATVARHGLATATLWDSALTMRRITAAAGGAPLLAGGRAERALGHASARAAQALTRLHGGSVGPGGAGVAQAVLRRVGLGATLVGGVSDLVHGEPGHGSARSLTTRALGGVAAVGSGALLAQGAGLAVAGGPVTLAVAGTVVTAYGVWKVGTAIYDHRAAIARAATTAVRGIQTVGRRATHEAARRLARAADDAGRAVGDGARRAQEATRGLGERVQGARRLLGPVGA